MTRVGFPQIYMNLAIALSQRSTCARLKVGAVVVSVDFSHVYGIGYNGNAQGLPNSCDSSEAGNCGCLHAEDNALLKTTHGPEIPKFIFVTHQPCSYCAKRIVNKGGFVRLYYQNTYRLSTGLDILRSRGIEIIHLESKGLEND